LPDASPLSGRRVAALSVLAAALHGAFDAVTYRLPWAAPPYLRLADAPEMFEMLSPVAVSVAASCVSGIIAAIAVVAVEPGRGRRSLALGAVIAGFWLLSAVLMRLTWLSTPWPVALVGIACGVPRGLVIGAVLSRLARGEVSDARARWA
jgi:hypothetical protein